MTCVFHHNEELWYNETVCLWMPIYIYIYIYPRKKSKERSPKLEGSMPTATECMITLGLKIHENSRAEQKYYIYIYIYIYIYKYISSGHATSTDLPGPLSPPFSIVHRSQEVFKARSSIGTELLYIGSSWSSCLSPSTWRDPWEYIAYEFILLSMAGFRMSGSSNFDSFRDGW